MGATGDFLPGKVVHVGGNAFKAGGVDSVPRVGPQRVVTALELVPAMIACEGLRNPVV